jgi:hypothetical protein
MAHALEKVESSRILIDHPLLTVTVGKYSYRIERNGDRSEYSVTNGSDTLTLPIRWAMGADLAIGQTYIIEKDGELFESHVSWFGLTKLIGLSAEQASDFLRSVSSHHGRDRSSTPIWYRECSLPTLSFDRQQMLRP